MCELSVDLQQTKLSIRHLDKSIELLISAPVQQANNMCYMSPSTFYPNSLTAAPSVTHQVFLFKPASLCGPFHFN